MIMQKIMSKVCPSLSQEEHGDLMKIVNRSRFYTFSFNRARGQGHGFLYALLPLLQKTYKDNPEKLNEAYKRENSYIVCTQQVVPFIMSLSYYLEKRSAKGDGTDASTINDMKASLMGPLSSIGDPFYQTIIPTIAAGVTMGLAQAGNLLGPILFELIYIVTNLVSRIAFAYLGYAAGTKFIDKLISGGLIQKITKAASLVGVMMIGTICATSLTVNLNWAPIIGGVPINIQTDVLDKIMPNLLSLVVLFVVYKLLRNKVSPNKIVAGIFVLNFAMAFLGMY
jgi:mannose/fructose/N-acetylgalactosamine-specific phosphotransferase system component IID